ncbi:ABC transporter permease [Paenibacillus sp. GYB003]|uniref:ABC transporter permease n=1 Tax=Paenibacillus sp. GYB003 TaxID=2994392 RepID=UPI002F96ACF6
MNAPSATFWALVRHELKQKGSWRKAARTPFPKFWRIVYVAVVLAAALGITTYFAIVDTKQLDRLWFATFGLPYFIFFFGFGHFRREWENDTYGWWLTLPYPRLWLVGAKWAAGMARVLLVWAGVLVFAALYASIIALALETYTFADVGAFMATGLRWLAALLGFSPLIMALGLFTATAQYTAIRPITPILWVVFMGGGGTLFSMSTAWLNIAGMDDRTGGETARSLLSQPWQIAVMMAFGALLAYLVVRLSAYLLERKLRV